MVKELKIDSYSYDLPEDRIALHPIEERDECRLLLRVAGGKIYHRKFKELPDLLPPGSMLVCNDTKVINARLAFRKPTGAAIELFLLEPVMPSDYSLMFQARGRCIWKCLVGNLKKWKEGEIKTHIKEVGDSGEITLKALRLRNLPEGGSEIEFSWDDLEISFGSLLEKAGNIPIPPYLNRQTEERDVQDYQTIYAEECGSVAAPTAGLHFTEKVFEGLRSHGIPIEKLTLHVGAGTFKPVKSENIGGHEMHSEPFTVTRELISRLIEWKKEGRKVVAVGTTTVRTLESLPYIGEAIMSGSENPYKIGQWRAYEERPAGLDTVKALEAIAERMREEKRDSFTANTSIMIAPGFQWRVTDIMITNFHQPRSTLLLLVSSFLNPCNRKEKSEGWREMYEEALQKRYRFLSYGDACMLVRGD